MAPLIKRPVLWITGIPSSGKTTLGRGLVSELRGRGIPSDLVDGDEVREVISAGLGFSKEDRLKNGRRISWIARLLARNGVMPVVTAVSPYREGRAEARKDAEGDGLKFFEIYAKCDAGTARGRDPKGTYRNRLVTGVDDPYEAPLNAEGTIETGILNREESLSELLGILTGMAAF